MMQDFVRDNQAYWRCLECGAEDIILKYVLVPKYDFPIIDEEKTIEGIQAFRTKHALCKKIESQTKLFSENDLPRT